jgi:hypothetical protein
MCIAHPRQGQALKQASRYRPPMPSRFAIGVVDDLLFNRVVLSRQLRQVQPWQPTVWPSAVANAQVEI